MSMCALGTLCANFYARVTRFSFATATVLVWDLSNTERLNTIVKLNCFCFKQNLKLNQINLGKKMINCGNVFFRVTIKTTTAKKSSTNYNHRNTQHTLMREDDSWNLRVKFAQFSWLGLVWFVGDHDPGDLDTIIAAGRADAAGRDWTGWRSLKCD